MAIAPRDPKTIKTPRNHRKNLETLLKPYKTPVLSKEPSRQGLLQIRGEVKKSDAVATLLSTKALQHMVTETKQTTDGGCVS